MSKKRIALAYSGGLDTSCIVPWLRENIPGAEVICVVGDVGQGSDELAGVEKKAKDSGAAECHVVDLKEEFVDEFVFPTMITGAVYEGRYLLGTAIARPILARGQVNVARETGCTALAHGCTGKGNDQVRFESAYAALAPEMEIIAPWRMDAWKLSGRLAMLDYLKQRNIPTTASATKIYSRDRNLWHISHEGGAIEDPWNAPPEDAWMLTADPAKGPDKPEDVSLQLVNGRPVALNGKTMEGWRIIQNLNDIAGKHGVGRIDLVENRRVGMKSRGLYETPGGTVIVEAMRALEELVLDRETRHYREHLGLTFAELVYDGRWFTPLREALWTCAEHIAMKLDGEIVVRLFKGTATAVKRKSPHSLYAEKIVSFEGEEVYSQKDAGGFIKLLSLPERIRALKESGKVHQELGAEPRHIQREAHMALWGGRFESGPDALFKALNDSLRFDYRLALEDIDGSIGWAKAIQRAGVLTADELKSLIAALTDLRAEIAAQPSLPASSSDEDIHSYVERRLIEKVGVLGKKLHTGRSRNDQVITDLRLWTRAAIDDRLAELKEARRSLFDLAERELSPTPTILPGYTHLQRAQPVLFAHWCLAYAEMLERDAARLQDARRRTNICPLGSGALAGTAYKIDRQQLAKDLGFDAPSANSLDAVSDRDFVLETLAAASICAVHLSRLGEDLILYGTQEFAFVEFDDSVSSGSSLMPQKKNPDSAELLRGKAGRVIGPLIALLTTVKGLPLAYNKNLQEDKEPLFLAMHHLSLCLQVVPRILDTLKVNRAASEKAAKGGHSNATDLADYLVGKGVPFREAHEQVGHAVRLAIAAGVALEDMPLDQLRSACPKAESDVTASLTLASGLSRREVLGGTGPASVKAALAQAKSRLS